VKGFQDNADFIFQIADLLRGPYRPNQYGEVVLPLVVLRRLDCVLAPTRNKVLDAFDKHKDKSDGARERILNRVAGQQFHNTSKLYFDATEREGLASVTQDAGNLARNLTKYIKSFFLPRPRHLREVPF
jgi:type I restriction enzyme M protein